MEGLRRLGRVAWLGGFLLLPNAVWAQSSISGLVRDATGAVLPGVTVEAASPALIEKTRSAATDGQGRYSIIELRPGTYTVTFSLQGFSTVRREGVEVVADASVAINAELRVGSVQERITVSAETPVVDIQQAAQRQVLGRDVLDAIPTNRTTASIGAFVPGLKMTGTMVGGMNSTIVQQYVRTRGKDGRENTTQIEGIDVGWIRGTQDRAYDNFGIAQEVALETIGAAADVSGGGVRINVIPREGGNTFSGDVFFSGSNGWQSNNITPALKAAGLPTPNGVAWLYDLNPSVGGRILRDRLWFFASGRLNHAKLAPAGAAYLDGTQGFNSTYTDNISFRLTWQINNKNKVTAYRDQFIRYQSHFGGAALQDWATVPPSYGTGTQYVLPIKWTSTLTNRLLVEAGYSHWGYDNSIFDLQEGVLKPNGSPEWFANASHFDLITNRTTVSGGPAPDRNSCCYRYIQPAHVWQGAVTYVTGSHQIKGGFQDRYGYMEIITHEGNAGLQQRYRSGVPDSVVVAAHPSDASEEIRADAGFYVMDRWTLKRLTVNAGIRVEYFKAGIGATRSPAGRFIPARSVDAFSPWPTWTDPLPRLSAVYDLFGNAKTALKVSAGKYLSLLGAVQMQPYNPISIGSDTRNWFDRDRSGLVLPTDGDGIAQENEIAPSTNPRFGKAADIRADPDLKRENSWDYSVGVQRELIPRVSISGTWYHTRNYNLWANRDAFYTLDSWTPFVIQNPCFNDSRCGPVNNEATLTVYNLKAGTKTGDLVTTSSDFDHRIYNGFEASAQARLARSTTIIGGWFADRTVATICDRNNPNQLRFCDQSGELHQELGNVPRPPFRHEFKVSGTTILPFALQASASLVNTSVTPPAPVATQAFFGANYPLEYLGVDYPVPAALFPGGRTIPVTVALIAPGTKYLKRSNQFDFSLRRAFRARKLSISPSMELYNLFNSSVVLSTVQSYGATLDQPTSTIPSRLLRLGVLVKF